MCVPITSRLVEVTFATLSGDVALDSVIMWVQLLKGCPNKIWEGKNVQNLARFMTTVDFERK